MNKHLEIFVKCFYVRTKIGLWTLSIAYFFGVGLDFHFKLLNWTRSGINLSPLISTVRTLTSQCSLRKRFGQSFWGIVMAKQQFAGRVGNRGQVVINKYEWKGIRLADNRY